jgi:hypothetical protein
MVQPCQDSQSIKAVVKLSLAVKSDESLDGVLLQQVLVPKSKQTQLYHSDKAFSKSWFLRSGDA